MRNNAWIGVAMCLWAGCASTQQPPPAASAAEPASAMAQPVPATSAETKPASIESDASQAAIATAAQGAHRSPENTARNRYRHPVETLGFFGLKSNMTVVELSPGAGWYTEILGPVLRDRGKLVLAGPEPKAEHSEGYGALLVRIEQHPEIYGHPARTVLAPPARIELGVPGSADMVLTFRNAHNWAGRSALLPVFAAAFTALKPGGVFGVVDHRALPGADPTKSAARGYLPESLIISTAETAGFQLAARSEVNANPKDTKDYPEGVWTLPPTLRLGEKDKDKYLAIGESDRMTLRFVKPISSAKAP